MARIWQQLQEKIWVPRKHGEPLANLAIVALLVGIAVFGWITRPAVISLDSPAQNPGLQVPASACKASAPTAHTASPVKVSAPAGTAATLDLFVGRGGNHVQRESPPLAIQGSLTPGTFLCMSASDLVRADGQTLPSNQVSTWAVVDNDGAHLTVFVFVSPRFEATSGFGGYTGTVSLNDPRALGADIPVAVNVEYPYLDEVIAFSLTAAFGGFLWARIVHNVGRVTDAANAVAGPFWISFILRIAVLLVTAIPVLSAQVLSNPGWMGGLAQYISIATLAGAAAIAVTPTLSTLVDKLQPSSPTTDKALIGPK